MSRGLLVRLVLVIGLLAGSAAIALTQEPKLGLDLSGGTQLTLETQSTDRVEADAEATDRTLGVLRGRVDSLGVSEPTLVRSGENRILVELPDLQDPTQAEEVLGKTAQLTVRPVVRAVGPEAEPRGEDNEILPDESGQRLEVGPVSLDGNQITGAAAVLPEQQVDYAVTVDFNGTGSDAFGELSSEAACAQGDKRRIAIVLDGRIISSPQVQVPCGGSITGSTQITGNFTLEEASDLALLIEGGALPVPVTIISRSVVGPTLGADAIDASTEAGIIGLLLTGLFIIIVYRFVGFLATLALSTYALLSYAMLLAVGATLTLPGLAGFVLAVGLAIDANVLVFERAREEYAAYPAGGLVRSLVTGFNKAWTAIIDSNVTTLLAAALLFALATGPVRGFGVTLTIGVVASMLSALVVARVLTEIGVGLKPVRTRPGFSGLGSIGRVRAFLDRKNPDLMRRRVLWLGISGAALLLAVSGIAIQGLNLGVEFSGGRQLQYATSQQISATEARTAVADAGYGNAVVQKVDDGEIAVRVGTISNEEADGITESLAEAGGGADKVRDETIGASFGQELRDKALIAFGLALLFQMAYLAVRFKWTFGVAAVAAMFHDVLLVLGLFAWLQRPIDGVFLAAALTIIGLSVNDTVVTFDRVRERWHGSRDATFAEVANRACIETLPRTVNTGLGAMFILGALAVLGGDSLRDFSLALLVGLVVGTYSSTFMATPLLTYLQQLSPLSRTKRERVQRDPQDTGAIV